MDEQDRIHWAYSSKTTEELESKYDEWAPSYDAYLAESTGYTIPEETVKAVIQLLGTQSKILDAGAGTGLTGEALHAQGYTNLHAIDLSERMLEVASSKNIYLSALRMKLGDELDFEDNSFDAVIVTGVFTVGHAKPDSLDELIRIIKPTGNIIFSINLEAYHKLGFKDKMDRLVEAGKWHNSYCSKPFKGLPNYAADVFHQVWGFEIRSG